MAREYFNRLVTGKVLHLMEGSNGFDIVDMLDSQELEKLPIKNVCAKVSSSLADELDSVAGLLGISKRRFIEAAFIEAIRQAREIIDQEGLEEYLVENHGTGDAK